MRLFINYCKLLTLFKISKKKEEHGVKEDGRKYACIDQKKVLSVVSNEPIN